MPDLLRELEKRSRVPQWGRSFDLMFRTPVLLYGANCLILGVGAHTAAPGDFGLLASTVAVLVLLSLPGAAVASLLLGASSAEDDDRPDRGVSANSLEVRSALGASVGLSLAVMALSPFLAALTRVGVAGSLLFGPYVFLTMLAAVPVALLSRDGRVGATSTVTLGSLVVGVTAGVLLVRSDPSASMLLYGNLLGAGVALGLGLVFVVRRCSASWWRGTRVQFATSMRILGRRLLAPVSFWLLAFLDVILARHYLPATLAGVYGAAAFAGRLLLFLPFAARSLERVGSNRHATNPERPRWMVEWPALSGAVLFSATLLMTLYWGQTVSLVFGGTFGSALLLAPPAISGAFIAASLVPLAFHLSVDSHAHYMTLFLVGLEVLLVVLWHSSSEMATVVVALTALSLLLQVEAAYAILRWEPGLAGLSEPEEVQRLERRAEGTIELSLVLPCYNAGSHLGEFIERLNKELAEAGPYELIVVSDGSTDETVAVAMASPSQAVRVLHYQVRSGKGHALRVGLGNARGRYVAFIDADGDIDPAAIGPFLSLMKMYTPDIILGSKRHPLSQVKYPPLRRAMSWAYHKLTRLLFRINVRDTQTGLKLIRRDVLEAVLPLMLEKRYAFDLEFLVVARLLGSVRVFEAPVSIDYRFRSQVNPEAVARIVLDTLAIFYRRYILNTYRRLERSRPYPVPAPLVDETNDGPHTGKWTTPPPRSLTSSAADLPSALPQARFGGHLHRVLSLMREEGQSRLRFLRTIRWHIRWNRFLTGRGAAVTGAAVAAAMGLLITRRVWGPSPPAGDDIMAHLVRARFGVDRLLARGQLDGWFPRFMVGHQAYLFYGPGFDWIVGLIRGLSLGFVSTPGAFKVAVIGSYVLLPAAVAFLASALGLNGIASAAAAVLSLGVSTRFGFGPEGLFGIGLVVHQIAGIFFFVALGGLAQTLNKRGGGWLILTAVAVAMLVVTHLISLAIFAVTATLFVLLSLATSPGLARNLPRAVLAVGIGCSLAAFWLVPFVGHRNLRGPGAGLAPLPLRIRLTQIIDGVFVYRSFVGVLVVLSILSVLVAAVRGWRPGFVLALLPIGYVLAVHLIFARAPNDLNTALVNRGWGYAGILAILPLAAVIGFVVRALSQVGRLVGTLVLSGFLAIVSLGPVFGLVTEFPKPTPQLAAAARELARLVPDGARFTIERRFEFDRIRTGVVHPDTWLVYASDRNGLVVFNPVSSISTAGFEERALETKPADESADSLTRYGVTHVVTTAPSQADRLSRSSRFGLVWQQPPIAIFEVRTRPDGPPASSLVAADGVPLSAVLSSAKPDHPRIEFDASRRTWVSVAIGWSPKWHARIDGIPVPIVPTHDYLLRIAVPEGRHRLALDFVPDWWDRGGRVLSLITLMFASAAGIVRLGSSDRRGSNAKSDTEIA